MTKETDLLRRHVASYNSISAHRRNCLAVCDEVDQLKKTILRYGQHDPTCKIVSWRLGRRLDTVECSCGLGESMVIFDETQPTSNDPSAIDHQRNFLRTDDDPLKDHGDGPTSKTDQGSKD